jgi:hypothetical protein
MPVPAGLLLDFDFFMRFSANLSENGLFDSMSYVYSVRIISAEAQCQRVCGAQDIRL